MMAERSHLLGMLQREDRAPFRDDSKPQAQRVVRCLWSCACQWCDVLTECSHFLAGERPRGQEALVAVFHVPVLVDIEIERICLFREGQVAAQTWL